MKYLIILLSLIFIGCSEESQRDLVSCESNVDFEWMYAQPDIEEINVKSFDDGDDIPYEVDFNTSEHSIDQVIYLINKMTPNCGENQIPVCGSGGHASIIISCSDL